MDAAPAHAIGRNGMTGTAADGMSEACGRLARALLVLFLVMLIGGAGAWAWLALIATAWCS